jgi:hypothetical protein
MGVTPFTLSAIMSAVSNLAQPGNYWTTTEFSNPTTYSATGGTFAIRRQIPGAFTSGRVIKYSTGTAPTLGTKFAVGVATNADPAVNQASGFTQVTWNGQPDPVTGGMWQGTANSSLVEIALSDSFSLNSVARTDGGSGFIVEGREFCPNGAQTVYSLSAGPTPGTLQYRTAGGVAYSGFGLAGDYVTTNQGGMGSPGISTHFIFHDLILFTSAQVFSVGAGGDSITRGSFSFDGRSNEIKLACDAITLSALANVTFSTCSRPGQGAAIFGQNSVNFINKVKPKIFFYTPNSPNDGSINSGSNETLSNTWLNNVKAACDANGTKLVVCTTVPWAVHDAVADTALRAYNLTLQNFATVNGCKFYDRYTPTTNGASPAALQTSYQYPTGTATEKAHPNDTCYQALSPAVQTIIRQLIGK